MTITTPVTTGFDQQWINIKTVAARVIVQRQLAKARLAVENGRTMERNVDLIDQITTELVDAMADHISGTKTMAPKQLAHKLTMLFVLPATTSEAVATMQPDAVALEPQDIPQVVTDRVAMISQIRHQVTQSFATGDMDAFDAALIDLVTLVADWMAGVDTDAIR